MLKQSLVIGAILTGLALPVAALADEAGTVSGGVAGAVGGAAVAGPVGAVLGGLGGAAIGDAMTNPPLREGRAAYIEEGRYLAPNSPYAILPQMQ